METTETTFTVRNKNLHFTSGRPSNVNSDELLCDQIQEIYYLSFGKFKELCTKLTPTTQHHTLPDGSHL
jgi:hypothetical protein